MRVASRAGLPCVGAMVIDAALFTPQSRPRLFIVAVSRSLPLPARVAGRSPDPDYTPPALLRAIALLHDDAARDWIWWSPPTPLRRNVRLRDIVEDDPADVAWHTREQTQRLLDLMSEGTLQRLRRRSPPVLFRWARFTGGPERMGLARRRNARKCDLTASQAACARRVAGRAGSS